MLLPLEEWHRATLRIREGFVVMTIDELMVDEIFSDSSSEEEEEEEETYNTQEEYSDDSTLSCEEMEYEGSWANPIDLTLEEE